MQTQATQIRARDRAEIASCLDDFEAAEPRLSQRRFAANEGIPRSTLAYWLERKRSIDEDPACVAFFESPAGLAFLHRLVVAAHFVMTLMAPCGIRLVAEFLNRAGLGRFVATSYGSQQKLAAAIEAETRAYATYERARLARQMTPRAISVCEDETFHPAICLVAMEPVSGFLLLEQYALKRDAATWTAAMKQACSDLPVTIIQATGDQAKALLAPAREALHAHDSPDLFHGQYDMSRATALALAARIRQAEEQAVRAAADLQEHQDKAQAWNEAMFRPSGRPPNFAARIDASKVACDQARDALQQARTHQEQARAAIRGMGQDYHPVDLKTGLRRTPDQVMANLTRHIDAIQTVAHEAGLSERSHEMIAKTRRLLPAFRATILFFDEQLRIRLREANLPAVIAHHFENHLLPAVYLERAAHKAREAETRPHLLTLAEQRALPVSGIDPLAKLTPEHRASIERVAEECADLFQRASSCVEGRNGQLSLRHHGLHTIAPAKLEVLTIMHNYVIQREDGTTAAERFFGAKPADLFGWLVDRVDLPARPAQKRPRSATPLLN